MTVEHQHLYGRNSPTAHPQYVLTEGATTPNVPTLVTPFATVQYVDSEGQSRVRVTVDWNEPTNTDGSAITDGAYYRVRWRRVGDPSYLYATVEFQTTQLDINDLAVGVQFEIAVSAVNKSGVASGFGLDTPEVVQDITPPSTPNAPAVAGVDVAQVLVTHTLGTAAGTFNLERDLDHLEVHLDYVTGFIPSDSTRVGALIATAGMMTAATPAAGLFLVKAIGVLDVFVKVVAVDRAGNRSAASAEGTVALDGIIEVLDAAGAQIALLNKTGFKVSAPPGASFVSMEPTAGAASVFLFPNDPTANSGEIRAVSVAGTLRTVVDSPFFDTRQWMRVELFGASADGVTPPKLVMEPSGVGTSDIQLSGKVVVRDDGFTRHLRIDRPGVNNLEFQPTTNLGGACQITFNDIAVAAIGANGFAYSDGQAVPRIRAGKTTMTFTASDTALATINYGFTFPAPPAVTATLSGGGIDQFALRMGTVGTGSVALRANTHDSAAITGDFEVNWIAIAVT